MAAITAAALTVAGTVYASSQAKKQQKQAAKDAAAATAAADPYAAYRGDAAVRLDKLQADPSSIQDSASWKARQQAAARIMASQGYTGSGNALVAAADAGGTAYQQEFDNLAMLSGANGGIQAAAGVAGTNASSKANAADTRNSATAGMTSSLGNLATVVGGRFNTPAGGG